MDQSTLYGSINIDLDEISGQNSPNETASVVGLSLFQCPSEDFPARSGFHSNYAGCVGSEFQVTRKESGLFGKRTPVSYARLKDGSTQTVAFSEWILGPIPGDHSPDLDLRRYTFSTPLMKAPEEYLAFLASCRSAHPSHTKYGNRSRGWGWMEVGEGKSLYDHNLTPDQNTCSNNGWAAEGAWTASSQHGGRVHVLFADGHTQPIMSTITPEVWRAISTRSGGEAIADGSVY
jgi:prepilin-type processing-associated H-X9-DG protein